MSTLSQPPIACCAKVMPLARTVNAWPWLVDVIAQAGRLSDVQWGLTQSGDVLKIESDCGLKPSVYLFAGFVQSDRRRSGERRKAVPMLAFAYKAEVEEARSGSANPFDTGGVWRGKTPSFAGNKESEAARELIDETKKLLDDWRSAFDGYLQAYFQNGCKAYMAGEPPDMVSSPPWGPDNLPAHHSVNQTDRHSWSWEVRIEEPFPIFGHLIAWSCAEDTQMDMRDRLSSGDYSSLPADWRSLFNQCILSDTFADALNETMLKWVEEQCRGDD